MCISYYRLSYAWEKQGWTSVADERVWRKGNREKSFNRCHSCMVSSQQSSRRTPRYYKDLCPCRGSLVEPWSLTTSTDAHNSCLESELVSGSSNNVFPIFLSSVGSSTRTRRLSEVRVCKLVSCEPLGTHGFLLAAVWAMLCHPMLSPSPLSKSWGPVSGQMLFV
jgi:hypothetical protein